MLEIYRGNDFTKKWIADRPSFSPIFDSDSQFYLKDDYYICFTFECKDGDYHEIEIFLPELFIFDGASIPRFFWRVCGHPLSPRFVVAALVHDALFGKINGRVKIWLNGNQITSSEAEDLFCQKNCDLVFKGILYKENNSGWKVRTMYRAVRIGGRFAFRKTENKFYLGEINKV